MDFLFEIKRLFLGYKIQMSVLGMLVPVVLVSVVYQFRFALKDMSYKVAMAGAFSTIAIVPIFIVFLQFTPALSVGSCLKHGNRFITLRSPAGESVSTTLVYRVKNLSEGKYELRGNDGAMLRVPFNRIDLDRAYKPTQNCGGLKD